MTWMLAGVSGAEEAELAIAAGVDIVDFATSDVAALRAAVQALGGRCRVSAGADSLKAVPGVAGSGVDFVRLSVPPGLVDRSLDVLADVARQTALIGVVFAEDGDDFPVAEQLAGVGLAGVMLDTADKTEGRLLDHLGPAKLARFVSVCRARGLLAGLAGGLEAPDVPRLLALDPDIIGFRRALCQAHDRCSTLDPDALAMIRRLIPPHREAKAGRAAQPGIDGRKARALDRVFVRDLVLEVSIGAYRHERTRPQRVRFEVVAEVARGDDGSRRSGDEMSKVFSYDVIIDTIRALVENRHVNLVETLAEEIAAKLLQHGRVAAVTVRVEKLDAAPAVVGVEIVRRAC